MVLQFKWVGAVCLGQIRLKIGDLPARMESAGGTHQALGQQTSDRAVRGSWVPTGTFGVWGHQENEHFGWSPASAICPVPELEQAT